MNLYYSRKTTTYIAVQGIIGRGKGVLGDSYRLTDAEYARYVQARNHGYRTAYDVAGWMLGGQA